MDAKEQFHIGLANFRQKQPDKTAQLGDVVKKLMDEQIEPQQRRLGSLDEVWGQLLPDELAQHCEIAGVSRGQLKVSVDSPAYMYELRLCSSELLSEVQQRCPRAGIKKIKFVIS